MYMYIFLIRLINMRIVLISFYFYNKSKRECITVKHYYRYAQKFIKIS